MFSECDNKHRMQNPAFAGVDKIRRFISIIFKSSNRSSEKDLKKIICFLFYNGYTFFPLRIASFFSSAVLYFKTKYSRPS